MTFTSICGFEEDEQIQLQYPDLYKRGLGTSPGQSISFGTDAEQADLLVWYATQLNPALREKAISSRYTNLGEKNDVQCSSLLVQ